MPAYFLLGLALLVALLVLGRLFANANPATLAEVLRWSAVVVLGGIGLLSLLRGHTLIGVLLGGTAALIWRGGRFQSWRRGGPGGAAGSASNVETAWFAMSLDHGSGAIDGEVRQGRFSGRRLSELSFDELLDLYDEVSAADPRSAPLLETFLDRSHEGWREDYAKRAPSGEDTGSRQRGWGRPEPERMSRNDALKILGLDAEPSDQEVKEAHRRLMMKHHPDRGGTDYFAAKINQAKEVLLDGG